MAVVRVTMQDIAEACGLSRNTVSKVFNDRGSVPEATRRLVLAKAQELGYGQFPDSPAAPEESGRSVALLTQHKVLTHSFGSFFVSSFTDRICRAGYTMKMFEISPDEIASKKIPPHLDLGDTAGIVCIELFDRSYLEMICSVGLPCVLVDGFAGLKQSLLDCDIVIMENLAASYALTQRMLDAGAKRIGFVGDKEHCSSFFERWFGYHSALLMAGIAPEPELCVMEPDGDRYGDTAWLMERLGRMPALPDGFVCANDYLAIHLMSALKQMEIRIPEDVMLTGFDGSPEAAVTEPTLTTAEITSAEIGRLAAETLIERIQTPDHPYLRIALKSTPIWGGSTR